MKLLQIFKDLTYGEFSQINIGNLVPGENESDPDPADYAKIITYINQGLIKIYSKFKLSIKTIEVQQDASLTQYKLYSDFAAQSASAEPIKYILDTADNPFEDDILKIERIMDDEGDVLYLDEPSQTWSITSINYRTIELPEDNEFGNITVEYRASHPKIVYSDSITPATIEVDIPVALEEALLLFIGYKAYGAQNLDGGQEANDYYQRFQASMQDVQDNGLYLTRRQWGWKFTNRGWV